MKQPEMNPFFWAGIAYYRVNWWTDAGAHTSTFTSEMAALAFWKELL